MASKRGKRKTNDHDDLSSGQSGARDVEMRDEDDDGPVLDLDVELEKLEDGGIRLGGLHIPPPPPPALTFDNDRPRLVITDIENENFKSYAGKQSLGPFHKSFTSIVGPNGSGKSNVIDSMLFVFGYRAQKIRSKKLSVLIHNSENHPDIRTCTVRVFFQEIVDKDDNPEGIPVENSQFCVSRTASKDNSSYYEINGKRQTLKEVSTFLKKKGIDLDHNRFLILQGEVEQIAQMKPKAANVHDTGMLEFLEDIIGSSRFQVPIDLLKKTKDELEELRGEKLNRVKLVEKEKDELEGPRNKAIEYLRFENQIVEKKNIAYQRYILEGIKEIKKVEEAKKKFEEESAEVLTKVEDIKTEREKLEKEHSEVRNEYNRIVNEKDEQRKIFDEHDMADTKIKSELQALNSKRKKMIHACKMAKESLEQNQSIPEANKTKIEECTQMKEKREEEIAIEQKKYDDALSKINAETKEYQDEKEKHETKLIELKKDVNEKESALRMVENELNIFNQKEDREKARLEQLNLSKDQADSRLKECLKRKEMLDKELPEAKQKLAKLEEELADATKQEEKMSSNVKKLESMFEEKRSNFQATRNTGRVLGEIMRQSQSGAIPGIFGRLGDLGAIDKRYDVAISTATGNGLDTILVDNVDTAKNCIQFLRRENIGRANFLALDKVAKWANKANERFQSPENVPRLFDLVEPANDKYIPAFYHVLRDTLVAQDIDQAQRIAYGQQRHRVVTLDGGLIEPSGSMSGGGTSVMRGKMGSEVVKDNNDDQNIKVLENELSAARQNLQQVIQVRVEKETAVAKYQKDVQQFTKEMDKLGRETKMYTEKIDDLTVQIKRQEKVVADAKPDPNAKKELDDKIESLKEEHEKSKESAASVEFHVKKLNGKIKEVMGSRLKSVQKKLDDLNAQLERVKAEIGRLEVEIKKAERNLAKDQDKIADFEAQISEAEQNMKNMSASRVDIEAKAAKAVKRVGALKEEEKVMEEKEAEVSKNIEELKKTEQKIKSDQIEVNEKLKQYETKIQEVTKKHAHWKREVKGLKLRDIPGETVEPLKRYSEEELVDYPVQNFQYELNVMEEKMGTMKPNQAAIEEFRRKEAVYLERVGELEDISSRRDKQRKNHDELRKLRLNEFMEGFSIITAKLKEMYQMITLGGDAELELVDTLDPFTEGIVFSVRPPNKSWKSISNLSGGEKTLSSLALIFALHFYKPTPLYVMDEIDAALDFKNVSIVANYIRERTKNAQFIIISLRSNMFELADRLVGIYKTYNCTKSVTINPSLLCASSEN